MLRGDEAKKKGGETAKRVKVDVMMKMKHGGGEFQ